MKVRRDDNKREKENEIKRKALNESKEKRK